MWIFMLIRSLLFYANADACADAWCPGYWVFWCIRYSCRTVHYLFNGSAAIRDETFERFFIVLRQLNNTLINTWFVWLCLCDNLTDCPNSTKEKKKQPFSTEIFNCPYRRITLDSEHWIFTHTCQQKNSIIHCLLLSSLVGNTHCSLFVARLNIIT